MAAPLKDLTGMRWGYVVYIGDVPERSHENLAQCLCRCEACGNDFIIDRKSLLHNQVKHCGCLRNSGTSYEASKEHAEKWDICNQILNIARKATGKPTRDKSENPYRCYNTGAKNDE